MRDWSIAITGGTGSLGTALVRALLDRGVRRIVVISRDEVKQSVMAGGLTPDESFRTRFFLGDVRDRVRMDLALRGVDAVIHAAALKRVESGAYNPSEVVQTNVFGTGVILAAALENGVQRVLLVSSDKATAPTTLYGATKMVAEGLTVGHNVYGAASGTLSAVVRYGNVLGSRGSVLHLWRRQAARKQLLTLTEVEMTRFIITMPQAVDFVLSALSRMRGGEIFIPRLPAAKMLDLAAAVSLHYAPEVLPWCRVDGPRPGGEKLHEELLTVEEGGRTRWAEDRYLVIPSFHPWTTEPWDGDDPGAAAREGYRSDRAQCLDVQALAPLVAAAPEG